MMRKQKIWSSCLTLSIYLCVFAGAMAQEGASMVRQQGFIRVFPLLQSWSGGGDRLSELSVPLFVYFPLKRNMSVTLQSSQANINSKLTEAMSGFSDTQVSMNYYHEPFNMIFNLGVNLPTGKKELTYQEFETSYLISLNMYDFRVPNFGQGLNVSPGVSWALPVKEDVVLGLGASFQYRGPFKPFEKMTGLYDPGDEILLTGGLDFRMNERSTFSADVIFTTYQKDKLDGQETFQSGRKIVVSGQYRLYINYNSLLVMIRYRSKDKNQVAIAGGFLPEREKSIPDQFELTGRYRMRLKPRYYLSVFVEGRFFNETSIFNRMRVFGLGASSEIPLSPSINIPVSLKYLICIINNSSNLSGFEIGAGVNINF